MDSQAYTLLAQLELKRELMNKTLNTVYLMQKELILNLVYEENKKNAEFKEDEIFKYEFSKLSECIDEIAKLKDGFSIDKSIDLLHHIGIHKKPKLFMGSMYQNGEKFSLNFSIACKNVSKFLSTSFPSFLEAATLSVSTSNDNVNNLPTSKFKPNKL